MDCYSFWTPFFSFFSHVLCSTIVVAQVEDPPGPNLSLVLVGPSEYLSCSKVSNRKNGVLRAQLEL